MSRPSRYAAKQPSTTSSQPGVSTNTGNDSSALAKAKLQFNKPLGQLLAIFPDWKEEDLESVLEESKGDVEVAVARISDGQSFENFDLLPQLLKIHR